jgi:hypothetical protein
MKKKEILLIIDHFEREREREKFCFFFLIKIKSILLYNRINIYIYFNP